MVKLGPEPNDILGFVRAERGEEVDATFRRIDISRGSDITEHCQHAILCDITNAIFHAFDDALAASIRQCHPTQPPLEQAHTVPHNQKKTVLDCWNGYHSVAIREEDRHLTTFYTPWGRYRYKTCP